MRSREVTVTLRIKYSIDEGPHFEEAYGVASLDHLNVGHVKAIDGDTKILLPDELVAEADHVEYTIWNLGPVFDSSALKVQPLKAVD